MKLKSKLMAAAIALVAASGAQAAIPLSFTGNGALFFTVFDIGANADDAADDRIYVRDLASLTNAGYINNWAATTTNPSPALVADKQGLGVTFSVASDANLTSFLAASTDTSRLQWNLVAADSNGTDRILTTAATAPTPMTYSVFRTFAQGGVDGFLGSVNPAGQSVVATGGAANLNLWGDNLGDKTAFSNTGSLGGSLNLFMLSEKGTSGTAGNANNLVTVQQYMADTTTPMQWTLASNGDLTFAAAVPEPSEYALMLAGLGMLGFMARRRLNNRA